MYYQSHIIKEDKPYNVFCLVKESEFVIFQKIPVDGTPIRYFKFVKQNVAMGFTLTGRDDLERRAPNNQSRILAMREYKEHGFKTFASVEPIIDFGASFKVIKCSAEVCDQFLIGLMSKNGVKYDRNQCAAFIRRVSYWLTTNHPNCKVYWKESVKSLMKDDEETTVILYHSRASVDRDWNLFSFTGGVSINH